MKMLKIQGLYKVFNPNTINENKVFEKLGESYDIQYKFPWNRLFEVEVCI